MGNNQNTAYLNDSKCGSVAAIFGATGMVGSELVRQLLITRRWKVYGIARNPPKHHYVLGDPNYHFISCDISNSRETQNKLSHLEDLTHVFWMTWGSQFPMESPEFVDQNNTMMSNVLNAILPSSKALRHVSLQTSTKHYIALNEGDWIIGKDETTGLFDESTPRMGSGRNFHYELEDLLQERLPGYKVPWSILRCGIIMGCSNRALYNFIGSLCVYGTICKYLNLPFIFGGTKECWEEMYMDAADSRLIAEEHIWAVTSARGGDIQLEGGQAYNAINGERLVFREIWGAIGIKLGATVSNNEDLMFSEDFAFSSAMDDKGDVWKEIVVKEGLVQTEMGELAHWDYLDLLFRLPIKLLSSRDKTDRMGFKTRRCPLDSILHWIDVMRAEKLIP